MSRRRRIPGSPRSTRRIAGEKVAAAAQTPLPALPPLPLPQSPARQGKGLARWNRGALPLFRPLLGVPWGYLLSTQGLARGLAAFLQVGLERGLVGVVGASVLVFLRQVNIEAQFRGAIADADAGAAKYLPAAFLDGANGQLPGSKARDGAPAHQPRHLPLAFARLENPLDVRAVVEQGLRVNQEDAADGDGSLAKRHKDVLCAGETRLKRLPGDDGNGNVGLRRAGIQVGVDSFRREEGQVGRGEESARRVPPILLL